MVTTPATDNLWPNGTSAPLMLEIFQGNRPSLRCPVRIKSLSARGVILASADPPPDLDWEHLASRDSLIHLPGGEVREIQGNLMWARPKDEEVSEMEFGLELSSSNLKIRRALEEHLQAYPEDLKNLWDHWDAVHDEYDFWGTNGSGGATSIPRSEKAVELPKRRLTAPPPETAPAADHTIYWVGVGAVLGGLAIYFLSPEAYRLFGVILAVYGSLTIAGKSMWSLMQRSPRSQE